MMRAAQFPPLDSAVPLTAIRVTALELSVMLSVAE